KADLARRMKIASIGAFSREEISHAENALKNALAAQDSTKQLLSQRLAQVDNTVIRSHPDVVAAAASLREAYISKKRTIILAPVDGTVTKRSVQVGQHIGAGVALMSVVPLNDLWVTANFKESQLKDIRIGQPVKLTADIYGDDVVYHGEIVGLDAGTGSAFSLFPAQNATGNWIKVTQRVPVKVSLDPSEVARSPLRVGLSMHVVVDTSNASGKVIRTDVALESSYHTQVFDNELNDANEEVEEIIRANEGSVISASKF
ncbi:TPA: HlyD family efflux transporter periplasmic adaptor subunit, partial [Pseudomonas aeruginosa]|nr:HlyD family efflux transporter periplasmic adaptor subunit [Pseudomonas aeruginosa]